MRGTIALNSPIVSIQTVNTFLEKIKNLIFENYSFDKICILNVAKSTCIVKRAILLNY